MVPVAGVEPARHRWRRILSPLRLPIPSYRQIRRNFGKMWEIGGHFGGQEAKFRRSDFKKPRKNQGFSALRCQLARRILSPLRLPIPSYRRVQGDYNICLRENQALFFSAVMPTRSAWSGCTRGFGRAGAPGRRRIRRTAGVWPPGGRFRRPRGGPSRPPGAAPYGR